MTDITQAAQGHCVVFSANTNIADQWMRDHYGAETVTFQLPAQQGEALTFREDAKKAKLTIGSL